MTAAHSPEVLLLCFLLLLSHGNKGIDELPRSPCRASALPKRKSLRLDFKLLFVNLKSSFFRKAFDDLQIKRLTRLRILNRQPEALGKLGQLLNRVRTVNVIAVTVGKRLFDKMSAVACGINNGILRLCACRAL